MEEDTGLAAVRRVGEEANEKLDAAMDAITGASIEKLDDARKAATLIMGSC